MPAQVTMDSREWDTAIREYSAATRKTVAVSMNRAVRNVMVKGAQICKQAEVSAIKDVESREWWPKYIASILRTRGAKQAAAAMGRAKTIRGQARAAARFTHGVAYTAPRGNPNNTARRLSRSIIRRRIRARGFIRFFFVALADALTPFVKGGSGRPSGRRFSRFNTTIMPATEYRQACEAAASFVLRGKRSGQSSIKTETRLQGTVNKALAYALADIQDYTERQIAKEAAKYSAR